MHNTAPMQQLVHCTRGLRALRKAVAVQGCFDLALEAPVLQHRARADGAAVRELDHGEGNVHCDTRSHQESLGGHLLSVCLSQKRLRRQSAQRG